MNKQIPIGEIRWLLKGINQGTQANNEIKKRLPADTAGLFAPMKIGNGFYQWTLPDMPLQPLSAANETDRKAIQQVFNQLHDAVTENVKEPHFASALLTTPDEDYIMFYADEEGNMQLFITGWGFAPTKSSEGMRIYKHIEPVEQKEEEEDVEDKKEETVTEETEDKHEEDIPPVEIPPVTEPPVDKDPMPDINVSFIDFENKPITGKSVSFSLSNGQETAPMTLDENGTCSFSRALCLETVNAIAHIHGDEAIDIPFTITPEENDYLLSELLEKESPKNQVLEIMLGILLAGLLVAIGYYGCYAF